MANAIEARKGLFRLWELLAKYPVPLPVVFLFQDLDNPLTKRRKLSLQSSPQVEPTRPTTDGNLSSA